MGLRGTSSADAARMLRAASILNGGVFQEDGCRGAAPTAAAKAEATERADVAVACSGSVLQLNDRKL